MRRWDVAVPVSVHEQERRGAGVHVGGRTGHPGGVHRVRDGLDAEQARLVGGAGRRAGEESRRRALRHVGVPHGEVGDREPAHGGLHGTVAQFAVAFAGVSKYPARIKCALMSWMALKDASARALATTNPGGTP